jgi:hypothetical protein
MEKPESTDQVQTESHDDPNVPTWQRAAPKATLFVDKNEGGTGENSGKVPYPKKFEDIIEFLQSGKEIPGILKIPDTVIDDPVSPPSSSILGTHAGSSTLLTVPPVDLDHNWPYRTPQALGEAGYA